MNTFSTALQAADRSTEPSQVSDVGARNDQPMSACLGGGSNFESSGGVEADTRHSGKDLIAQVEEIACPAATAETRKQAPTPRATGTAGVAPGPLDSSPLAGTHDALSRAKLPSYPGGTVGSGIGDHDCGSPGDSYKTEADLLRDRNAKYLAAYRTKGRW